MSSRDTFVDLCLVGKIVQDEIDDFIDRWHEGEGQGHPLHDFLGMTKEEYNLWVEKPGALRLILAAREQDEDDLYGAIERFAKMEPVATRAADPQAAKDVLRWLRKTGRIS